MLRRERNPAPKRRTAKRRTATGSRSTPDHTPLTVADSPAHERRQTVL